MAVPDIKERRRQQAISQIEALVTKYDSSPTMEQALEFMYSGKFELAYHEVLSAMGAGSWSECLKRYNQYKSQPQYSEQPQRRGGRGIRWDPHRIIAILKEIRQQYGRVTSKTLSLHKAAGHEAPTWMTIKRFIDTHPSCAIFLSPEKAGKATEKMQSGQGPQSHPKSTPPPPTPNPATSIFPKGATVHLEGEVGSLQIRLEIRIE